MTCLFYKILEKFKDVLILITVLELLIKYSVIKKSFFLPKLLEKVLYNNINI